MCGATQKIEVLFPWQPEDELHALFLQLHNEQVRCLHAVLPIITLPQMQETASLAS